MVDIYWPTLPAATVRAAAAGRGGGAERCLPTLPAARAGIHGRPRSLVRRPRCPKGQQTSAAAIGAVGPGRDEQRHVVVRRRRRRSEADRDRGPGTAARRSSRRPRRRARTRPASRSPSVARPSSSVVDDATSSPSRRSSIATPAAGRPWPCRARGWTGSQRVLQAQAGDLRDLAQRGLDLLLGRVAQPGVGVGQDRLLACARARRPRTGCRTSRGRPRWWP